MNNQPSVLNVAFLLLACLVQCTAIQAQDVGVEDFTSDQYVNRVRKSTYSAVGDVCHLKPLVSFWSDLDEPFMVRVVCKWEGVPGTKTFFVRIPPASGLINDNVFTWSPNDPWGYGIWSSVQAVNGEIQFKKKLTVSILWHAPSPHSPNHQFDGDELAPDMEFEWVRQPPNFTIPDFDITDILWPIL